MNGGNSDSTDEADGRLAGLSAPRLFTEASIEVYPEIQRWKKRVRHVDTDHPKPTTWERVFRPAIVLYCNFLGMTPTEIIDDRRKTFARTDDEMIRRKHEELYDRFVERVKLLSRKDDHRKRLASWTQSAKVVAVRSFYKRNYYALVEVEGVRGKVERLLHIPTQEELGRMVLACENTLYSAAMVGQAQSGMGEGDLLSISWDQESADFGTVAAQLRDGREYIHVHFDRGKTGVTFDSFFGPETLRWMRKPEFPKSAKGLVFDFKETTWQQRVRKAQAHAKVPGIVTAHCLRKFFSNQLKLTRVGDPAWEPDLIEYWCGHSLGGIRSAYMAPSVPEQLRLRRLAEARLVPIYPPEFERDGLKE